MLNDGSYQRLGDSQTLYSEFQVIAASNVDLYAEVDQGRFLLDLASRLVGLAVTLKPLRERKEDLPVLVELALARFGVTLPEAEVAVLAQRCAEFYWRGNIRELFQVIRAMVILSGGDSTLIGANHLPVLPGMLAPGAAAAPRSSSAVALSAGPGLDVNDLATVERGLKQDQPLDASMDAYERLVLQAAVARHETVTAAAEALGTSRSAFNSRRRRLGISAGS